MADAPPSPAAPSPSSRSVPQSSSQRRRPKKPLSGRRRWTYRILKTLAALALLGVVGLTAFIVIGYQTTKTPDPNKDFQTATTDVYFNNGKSELGTFAIQNRQPLTFNEIPQNIKQAVVSAENRSFWTDRGISIRGMFRAAWTIARGGTVQGGSTITQQYIKIMYLNQDQTLTRKIKEVFLAAKINKELSKDDILAGYLNTIYFGRGAYGIQAASKAYFDVDAKLLTVPQSAVLASVINNPSLFDPSVDDANTERLLGRYHYVLASMAETGAITAEQAATYARKLPTFPTIETNQRYGGPTGFLLKMVQRELAAAGFDSSRVSGGGLKITTTFDQKAQEAAVKSAQRYTKKSAKASGQKASQLHAAIASVEVGTGNVLALYAGPDYVKNSRNWATTPRPTASTFKAYALAAGLKDGASLLSTYNGNTFTPPGDSTKVRNEYSTQYGSAVTLLKATTDSINTAFVDLTTSMKDGPQKISDMAQAAGAPKGPGWELSSRIALGTAEVSPLAQAGAYATFGNEGKQVANHVVKEVRDARGKVIWKANPEERRAVSADVAADVTYALSNVVEQGTGRTVQTLNRPVAGKTGTKDINNTITSAWFVGYTRQISTAVMYVAGDSGAEDLDKFKRPGDSTFFGGTYPALTWADYMETASKDLPIKDFPAPAYVNKNKAQSSRPAQTYAPYTPQPSQSSTPSSSSTTPTATNSATPQPSASQTTTRPPPPSPSQSKPQPSASASRSSTPKVPGGQGGAGTPGATGR